MEKLLYKGQLLKLYRKTVILPNGYKAGYEIIKHPGASLIVPFLNKKTIIMLRQLRPVVGTYLYELPAGTRDANESYTACARREIVEETGYSAKKIRKLGSILPVPGYSTEQIAIFKAEQLTAMKHQPEQDEIIQILEVSISQVRTWVARGRIVDAKTICALSLAECL
jgi:ADP-ribose pyrophosphatase